MTLMLMVDNRVLMVDNKVFPFGHGSPPRFPEATIGRRLRHWVWLETITLKFEGFLSRTEHLISVV